MLVVEEVTVFISEIAFISVRMTIEQLAAFKCRFSLAVNSVV
jgi:hypothetical protein